MADKVLLTDNNGNIIYPITHVNYVEGLENIEAAKLKNPVKLWGREFDGSEDVEDEITIDYIYIQWMVMPLV